MLALAASFTSLRESTSSSFLGARKGSPPLIVKKRAREAAEEVDLRRVTALMRDVEPAAPASPDGAAQPRAVQRPPGSVSSRMLSELRSEDLRPPELLLDCHRRRGRMPDRLQTEWRAPNRWSTTG